MALKPQTNYDAVIAYLASIGLDARDVAEDGNTETTYSRVTHTPDGDSLTIDTPWPDGFDWDAFQAAHRPLNGTKSPKTRAKTTTPNTEPRKHAE